VAEHSASIDGVDPTAEMLAVAFGAIMDLATSLM
jgi:hypothetical protein